MFLRIASNLFLLLTCAAMNVEEEQRHLSYYSCHFTNMLPGSGEAWERTRDEFVAATMADASNASTPTPACVAWVCDSSLKVWQVRKAMVENQFWKHYKQRGGGLKFFINLFFLSF